MDAAAPDGRTTHDESDEALALRAGRGDARAFEALVERRYDAIRALAWRLDANHADDLAQDVCVRLPHALHSFKGDAAFRTWLHRLVVNAARDAWRRRGAYDRAIDGWAEVEPMRRADGAERRERGAWLDEATARLGPALRETVALVLGEELTQREAAGVLDVSEGTVAWRMSEVKRLLRTMARDEAVEAGAVPVRNGSEREMTR